MPAPKDPIKYAEYVKRIGDSHRGRKQSEEWIKKRVEKRKSNNSYANKLKGRTRPPFSQEWCDNISKGQKGKIVWNKGLKTGPLSEEHKANISKSNSKPKAPFTQEHKDNIKKARALQIIPKRTDETKEKIRAKRAYQIIPIKDSKPERMMQIALTLNGIQFKKHKMIRDCKGFYHQVDIFIEPNICIEVDGDYWHRLPKVLLRDTEVNHKLNLMGYHIIRIWEKDIISNVQNCIINLIGLIKMECI